LHSDPGFEVQIRDLRVIRLEHRVIAIRAERPAVMPGIVMDELSKARPIPRIEAGDSIAMDHFTLERAHARCHL
jgi:hypothetical protein